MKVVCVNYTYDRSITDPDHLLERYETLVGWAEALTHASADVSVIQRFGAEAERFCKGVRYSFVFDPSRKDGSLLDVAPQMHAAAAAERPDMVHVNGLQFARQAQILKRLVNVPMVIQDHASPPSKRWIDRWTVGRALRQMDAVSFVSREQAQPWIDAGLLHSKQIIFELMEGSSRFVLKSRETAREKTRLAGDPLCLWVGRLDANKDPLTVLRGFAGAQSTLANARLVMVFSKDALLADVQRWLSQNPKVSSSVELLGYRTREALEDIFNSADLFVLGSHHEGSGYSVLEALSCGVAPVVTDIPSFRVLTGNGEAGSLWPPGDSESLAQALVSQYSKLKAESRQETRSFFDANFHWNEIGQRAFEAYKRIADPSQGKSSDVAAVYNRRL